MSIYPLDIRIIALFVVDNKSNFIYRISILGMIFFLIFYRQVSILMDHPLSFFFTLDYVFTKYSYDACTPKVSMRILGFVSPALQPSSS